MRQSLALLPTLTKLEETREDTMANQPKNTFPRVSQRSLAQQEKAIIRKDCQIDQQESQLEAGLKEGDLSSQGRQKTKRLPV